MTGPAHRFFVDPDNIVGETAVLRGDQARQISTVLRLGSGDTVVLVVRGDDIEVRLDRVSAREVTGTVISRTPNPSEPWISVVLALPLLRGDRSEEVIEAVTQLGIQRIVPFVSERSVVRELSEAKRERWSRIARESAETARRGRVPEVTDLVSWAELFDHLPGTVLVAWEGEPPNNRIGDLRIPLAPVTSLVIGPEGGLSSAEIALARNRGALIVSLGPRNLRSETAAIAAIAKFLADM